MSGLGTNVPGLVPQLRDAVATQLLPTLSLTLWSCLLRLVFPGDLLADFCLHTVGQNRHLGTVTAGRVGG